MSEQRNEDVVLNLRVQPKASRNAIAVEPDGRVRVALTAPPVDGEANEALRVFIAKTLGIPRRDVTLVRGEKSRDKTLSITGLTKEHVLQKLGMG